MCYYLSVQAFVQINREKERVIMDNSQNAYAFLSKVHKLNARQLSRLLTQVRKGQMAIGNNIVLKTAPDSQQKQVIFTVSSGNKQPINVTLITKDNEHLMPDLTSVELYSVIQRPIKKPSPSKESPNKVYGVIQRPIAQPAPSKETDNPKEAKKELVHA